MKETIIEHKWLFIIIGLVTALIVFLESKFEQKNIGGVVYEHNVTADKYGERTYSTIIKTDDGFIEEKTGLKLYTIPVGNRVTIEVTRAKK